MSRSKALIEATEALAGAKSRLVAAQQKRATLEKAIAASGVLMAKYRKVKLVYQMADEVREGDLSQFRAFLPWSSGAKVTTLTEAKKVIWNEKVDTGFGGQVKITSLAKRVRIWDAATIRKVASLDRRIAALQDERRKAVQASWALGSQMSEADLLDKIARATLIRHAAPGGGYIGNDVEYKTDEVARLETHVAHLRKSAKEDPDNCAHCKSAAKRRESEREWAAVVAKNRKESAA